MKVIPRRQGKFGFSASADATMYHSFEDVERLVEEMERHRETATAANKSKLAPKKIWNEYNRRT